MKNSVDSRLLRPLRKKLLIYRTRREHNAVAITFDDGPRPANTPRLLELLEEAKVSATFFLIGSFVERYPDLAREIAAQGHEIGGHSFSHRRRWEVGFRSYAEEIGRTSALIEKCTRCAPRFFRPPYGEYDLRLLGLMAARRMKCVLWTVDHHDYLIGDKDTLVRLVRESPLVSGDILLFHEYNRSTVEAMPEIIREIRSRGLVLGTVSELLRRDPGRTGGKEILENKNTMRRSCGAPTAES